jgi:hypothetical protein
MSTSSQLQEYLAVYNIGLAKILRFVRRVLEDVDVEWVISGRMAMILYAYMLNFPNPTFPQLNITININSVRDRTSQTEHSMIALLKNCGFMMITDETYPENVLAMNHFMWTSIRLELTFSKNASIYHTPLWIDNIKGKHLYPLENINHIMTQAYQTVRGTIHSNDTLVQEILTVTHDEDKWAELNFLKQVSNNVTLQ